MLKWPTARANLWADCLNAKGVPNATITIANPLLTWVSFNNILKLLVERKYNEIIFSLFIWE